MKNDYNVSISASGGVGKRSAKGLASGGSDDESSYSQSMTVTTSLEKANALKERISNFEYLKQKYLQGGAGGGLDDVDDTSEEEDESESESKSTAKRKK